MINKITKKNITKKIISFLFTVSLIAINTTTVMADISEETTKNLKTTAEKAYGGSIPNEMEDAPTMIGKMVGTALSFLGIIFLVLMIYGGFLWMVDRGEGTHAKKAKELIEAAIIGLFIVMSAYAITAWIGEKVTNGQ